MIDDEHAVVFGREVEQFAVGDNRSDLRNGQQNDFVALFNGTRSRYGCLVLSS